MKGILLSEVLRLFFIACIVNAAFALFLYLWATEDDFNGIPSGKDAAWGERFIAFFYFGVTTFTTTGYGDISPKSRRARLVTSAYMISVFAGALSFFYDF